MKKHNTDYIDLHISSIEFELLKAALDSMFSRYNQNLNEKNKKWIPVIFNNNYLLELCMYLLEQIYEKVIKLRFSIFDEYPNTAKLRLTQIEVEILYVVHSEFADCELFINQLKEFAKWLYFDKNLEMHLEPDKEQKLDGKK
jgi:hypothetical protein